jgi:hypothetical protein
LAKFIPVFSDVVRVTEIFFGGIGGSHEWIVVCLSEPISTSEIEEEKCVEVVPLRIGSNAHIYGKSAEIDDYLEK